MSRYYQKEIGGYFEFEHFDGAEFYPDLLKLNLGRTSLVWLLDKLRCKRILIPSFICDSVTAAAEKTKSVVELYDVEEDLRPPMDLDLGDKDWLYVVNYYGQLGDDEINRLRDHYKRIIVDNAQAFFQKPVDQVHTIYSCRKFIGTSDGAYISTDLTIDTIDSELDMDRSSGRLSHIMGRLEESAGAYYQTMLKIADGFADEDPKSMSLVTQNILRAINYEGIICKRNENYAILQKLLPTENVFKGRVQHGPFAYPYYHRNGLELRKYLAEHKIFVPTYWKNIIDTMSTDSKEYDWAANILPLPVDQRYDAQDMEFIAKTIKNFDK